MNPELTTLIQNLNQANLALMDYLNQQNQSNTSEVIPAPRQPIKVFGALWDSATTTEVSEYTMEKYDWKPLWKFCQDKGIILTKKKIGHLEQNDYPAEAWLMVYGILLGSFN